jgi:squalene-associated FAD-dependent desaturase
MKKVLIIGGGLSGLASAIFLLRAGYQIELIEAAPKFGGRTYSFDYKGVNVDNGQHILMECYTNTLEYIDIIGSRNLFAFQNSLSLNSIDGEGNYYRLKTSKYFHPLNKLFGIMNFKLLTFSERLALSKFLIKLKYLDENEIKQSTTSEFLEEQKQSERVINLFWKNVVESTMNTALASASAKMFVRIAKIIFFSNKNSANAVIPNRDLTSALVTPAINKIIESGGKISSSEKAISFDIEGEKIISVKTNKRRIKIFDFIISAIPEYGLKKISVNNSANKIETEELSYSSIVTVHMFLDKNPLTEKMYNMVNSEFDWLFNHGTYITLLKSNAVRLVNLDKNKVIKIAFSELKKYFTILTNREIKDYIVLKEKRATFISDHDSIKKRKSVLNPYLNLFLVGDWVDTGLPATIEGAIKSSIDVIKEIKDM